MSDKYEDAARESIKFFDERFFSECGRQTRINELAARFKWFAAKLEKETCENCIHACIGYGLDNDEIDCEIILCTNTHSTMRGVNVSEDCRCSKWSRRIVEKVEK